jgi:transcription-repair coupling factor (superfamily II helicase)
MQDHYVQKLPKLARGQVKWSGLLGVSKSIVLADMAQSRPLLIVTPDINSSLNLKQELDFFKADHVPVYLFPDWEVLPYDMFSPHEDIISARLQLLNLLPTMQYGVVIVALSTLMHRLPPKNYLLNNSMLLKVGAKLDPLEFKRDLVIKGYRDVAQVHEHGEFRGQGSVVDVFPMGADHAYRIDFFDDEIDSMRILNIDTQASVEVVSNIELLPTHEVPLSDDSIAIFKSRALDIFGDKFLETDLYDDVINGSYFQGIEYYLPLFFNELSSLFNYVSNDSLTIYWDGLSKDSKIFLQGVEDRYQQLAHDITRPLVAPHNLFLKHDELFDLMHDFGRIVFAPSGQYSFAIKALPDLKINRHLKEPLQLLHDYIAAIDKSNKRILLCADSKGRQEIMLDFMRSVKIYPKIISSWAEFQNSDEPIAITVASLTQGVDCEFLNIIIIAEADLFGERVSRSIDKQINTINPENIIKNLVELSVGDPVVHLEHGVGRFNGLKLIELEGSSDEYLELEYKDGDKLFVPVTSLNLISRYSGYATESAPLNKLGSSQWEKTKKKVVEKIYDAAAELLNTYAKREIKPGFAYASPSQDNDYNLFAADFAFEETIDQQKAIDAILADMIADKAMDRLICGDVGFGKTEVAMRAAFVAIKSGKQVAVLVPTTLLANQHYQNFKDRFASWPVNVEALSRFKTKKEQAEIIDKLQNGKIDIVIGTHGLLSSNVAFSDLGLLIIDEEHRFGVRQKEKLKSFKVDIDVLTLTATPIPRTLNMTFSGIRDLSLITTPPQKRLSVKTFYLEKEDQIIKEAIAREVMRGGQVYYLHNKVEDITKVGAYLSELLPSARIGIAHGQMSERQLEDVMRNFYHRHFNVLVCTTIVESGIDVPSANTIIIDKADHLGLAQLHQLRGRVGRSHHQAYAYLLVNSKKFITKDAEKRLDAVMSCKDLGLGFTLATHDMEIRGVGEILGEEQSGHAAEIGFELYMDILNKAVRALKSGAKLDLKEPFAKDVDIDFHVSAIIPSDYIPDVNMRLVFYKRIASVQNKVDLDNVRVEIIDRFGLLPEPLQRLFELGALRLFAQNIGIKSINANDSTAHIEFLEHAKIDPAKIINLIQRESAIYKLSGANALNVKFKSDEFNKRIDEIIAVIKRLRLQHKN